MLSVTMLNVVMMNIMFCQARKSSLSSVVFDFQAGPLVVMAHPVNPY
jgi:hypothetical protein